MGANVPIRPQIESKGRLCVTGERRVIAVRSVGRLRPLVLWVGMITEWRIHFAPRLRVHGRFISLDEHMVASGGPCGYPIFAAVQ